MQTGVYQVSSPEGQHERLTVQVDGSRVSIAGPFWNGTGIVVGSGDYVGNAKEHRKSRLAYHTAVRYGGIAFNADSWAVLAWFEGESSPVALTWTRVDSEAEAA